MKKINLILLMLLVSTTGLLAQNITANPFTQNIHFAPEPTVAGFGCGTSQLVEFTQGFTTAADATQWQTDPLTVTICIGGFDWDGANAAAIATGSYASNFTWAFDANSPNCIIGTQNQTLFGTGTSPLFPNPNASGLIALALKVPETSPISTVLSVDVTLQIPSYFQFNSAPDDNESTQTQTFCALSIAGTIYHDTLATNGTIDKGMPLGNPDNAPLYVNLLDNTGTVVGVQQVANDGTYEFTNVDGFETYTIVLTSTPGTINTPGPVAASYPPNWQSTGEDCCDGTGEDLNPNGILTVTLTNASREMADFGINQVIPTPVVMSSFEVTEFNCNTLVSWATASEENVSHFEVMRENTNGEFVKIARIEASGNSTSQKLYNYVDKNVEKREASYNYMVKIVDIDFAEDFTKVKTVKIACGGDEVSTQVFPNPAQNSLNLVYTTEENDIQLIVDIVDLTGRKLMSTSKIVNKGTSVINLDIKSLAIGQYMVRYHSVEGNTTGTIKFTKEL